MKAFCEFFSCVAVQVFFFEIPTEVKLNLIYCSLVKCEGLKVTKKTVVSNFISCVRFLLMRSSSA